MSLNTEFSNYVLYPRYIHPPTGTYGLVLHVIKPYNIFYLLDEAVF